MRRIYEPRDLLEAEMLSGMLVAEGIEAFLAGSHLIGAMGELPAAGLLGLMVPDEDAERAPADRCVQWRRAGAGR